MTRYVSAVLPTVVAYAVLATAWVAPASAEPVHGGKPPVAARKVVRSGHHEIRKVAAAPSRRRKAVASDATDVEEGPSEIDSAAPRVRSAAFWTGIRHSADEGGGGALQTGLASWYGGAAWQGHRRADGGSYDQEELTAAHATLPMGSRVRVSTLDGSSSVVVRITDRPGTRKRIIDLSRAAARELGMLSRGVAMVSLHPVEYAAQ